MVNSKYLLIALLIILSAVTGCGSKKNTHRIKIGFSQCTGTAEWRKVMLDWMEREMTFHPEAEFIYREAKGNNNRQISQIRELVTEGIDILLVSPNEPKPLTPVIEEVYNKKIPVIVLERKSASALFSTFIGADNFQIGAMAGNYIKNSLNGHGKIIEIKGLENSTPSLDRHLGLVSSLKNTPGIKILASLNGQWLQDSAASEMMKARDLFKDADFVFAQNDVMAIGAKEVYKKLGISRKIKFIGIDGLPGPTGGIEQVAKKELDATLLYPTGGSEAIQIAFKILNGEPFNKEYNLQSLVIDSSNVRIMNLQLSKISNQQSDIERRQKLIEKQIAITDNQRSIIYITSIILALALILGSIAVYYLNENRKINRRLEKQNKEILNQRNQLIEQQSQLMDMTAKAKEATDAKFNFFTSISHEFRTPLTLILGPLEHVIHSSKLHSSHKGYLEIIQKNTFRLLKLVNQLIDYRKIEYGKMKLRATKNDIVSFVFDIANNFQELSRKDQVSLSIQAKEKKLDVWFDINMLDKVIFNLLSNAFKFTPQGGTITLQIGKSEDGKYAIVNVGDSGIGMSAETAEHAFDLFYHGNHSRSTGIGLNLSRELVKIHKGSIIVSSEKNKGTNIQVMLPLGDEHLSPDDKNLEFEDDLHSSYEDLKIYTSEFNEIAALEGPKSYTEKENSILIIEDNDDLRLLLKTRLEDKFEILDSANGDQGLQMAFDTIPDIILCDIVLPGKEGMQIINILKNDIRTSHIPVILVTAKGNMEVQIKGMQQKADAFIVKPFNLTYLEETINSVLKNREILKEHYSSELSFENKSEFPKKIDRKFINEFVAIVEEGLGDEHFGVDDICKKIGISRVQLYRKVKALLGYNINDYIISVRLKKATLLLAKEDLSISEIAFQVGFSSQAYFARLFKNKLGTTPTEYRANSIGKTKFV